MMKESLALLGLPAKDLSTGFEGVVTSISFDLYGCVAALITPPVDKDGKLLDSAWFDVKRIGKLGDTPVLPRPSFMQEFGAERGAASRPLLPRTPTL